MTIEHSEIYNKALERTRITDEKIRLSKELLEIKKRRIQQFPMIRAKTTSDKQADMMWQATEDGIREMELKHLIEALKERRSDIRLEIDVLQDESRNQF